MMTLPEGYTQVDLTKADRSEILQLFSWAFATERTLAAQLTAPDDLDYARTLGIRDAQGRLVAVHSSLDLRQFSLPGAEAHAAGLTWVSVHPEHRRRGLLSVMIRLHLERCAQRGEVLSVLTATEPVIYGRFGYGHAADTMNLTLSRKTDLRPVPGSDEVRITFPELDPALHSEVIDQIHRTLATRGLLRRPGWVTRDTSAIREASFQSHGQPARGYEPLRLMLAERAGKPVGYALFRRNDVWDTWTETGPAAEVSVKEYAALDGAAAHALWSRLLDLDLTASVNIWPLSIDDEVYTLLVDKGAAKAQRSESLWVRLVDVPAALAARSYAADLDIVLELRDALRPANAGRWHLSARAFAKGAQVEPLGVGGASGRAGAGEGVADERGDAPADITLDVRELGAIYLGGTNLAALAAAGLVEARSPEVLLRAAAAFAWPCPPACNWEF